MSEDKAREAVLEMYRMTVRNLLSGTKPGMVPNSSYRHASIIIDELARCSKSSFHAYCARLSPDVWTPDVIEQLRAAVNRNVDVVIVTAEQIADDVPPFLRDRIKTIEISSMEDVRMRAAYAHLSHFTVVDGKSFRLERDTHNREAVFAANHPEFAGEVEKAFSAILDFTKAA